MRGLLLSMLLLAVPLAPTAVRADPRGDALALLDLAIQAHGGKAGLGRAATFQRNGTGVVYLPNGKQGFRDTVVGRLPDRLRVSLDVESKVQITMVADDKRGWKAAGGTTLEMPEESLAEFREEAYTLWLATLVPLAGDGFTLAPAGAAERDGKAVVGVKVAHKGHFDAVLWFDKATRLLVLIEKEAMQAGNKVRKSYALGEHREFAGVKLPTRLVEKIGDQIVTEATIQEYRFPEKIDDATFGKP